MIAAQKKSHLPSEGNNIFINDGPVANQHVPHVHLHVLPRRKGDLPLALFSFVQRYTDFFGQEAKRKRLDKLAQELGSYMPEQVQSDLIKG